MSSLLFCTGIQFSCYSICVLDDQIKIQENRGLWTVYTFRHDESNLIAFFQMMNGLREFEVKYSGDPELQPICSFENPALVRLFYKLSTHLNKKVVDVLSSKISNSSHLLVLLWSYAEIIINRQL